MKALEILKNGISFMTMHKDLNPQSREYLESEISQYEEAIKELEALKSCDGCKCTNCKLFDDDYKMCSVFDIRWSQVGSDFYCCDYEPKDK